MNLFFQQSRLWLFALLVAGPLLVHLLARARPSVVRFPSLAFLRPLVRHSRRIKRPQDWLLFLLRTLFVAAVVLLFLRPVLFRDADWAGGGGRRAAVLVVDASASMGYTEGAQSRFSAATAAAADILAGFGPNDRVNLIWVRNPPRAVFPAPDVNHRALRAALRRAAPTLEPGDVPAALRLADGMLQDVEGRRELYLVSDFQGTQWQGVQAAISEGVRVVAVPAAPSEGRNLAVSRVRFDPPAPLTGEEVRLYAGVHNYSPAPRRFNVFLQAGEKRERRDVRIGAWGEATVVLPFRTHRAGPVRASVEIEEDAFPGDNRRDTVVDVRPFLRVGLVEHDADRAYAWRRVFESLAWARHEPVRPAAPPGGARPDVLVLAGWTGDPVPRAHTYGEGGGAIIWHPGAPMRSEALAALEDAAPAQAGPGPWPWETTRESFPMDLVAPSESIFRVFEEGTFGDPSAARAFGRIRIPPDAVAADRVLIRYRDGVPALARLGPARQGFLWNIPLHRNAGTMQSHPEWVALVGEMLLQARGGDADPAPALVPGDRPRWQADREVLLSEIALHSPEAGGVSLERRDEPGGTAYLGEPAAVPGVYEWRLHGAPAAHTVVRFPERESDLRSVPDPDILNEEWITAAGGREARSVSEGRPLWPWLLVCAVGLALIESSVAWWSRTS